MAQPATAFPAPEEKATFDLVEEAGKADQHKPWPSGIYSKTLWKQRDIRLVLVMTDAGAKLKEHHADGSVTIHVLEGHLRVQLQNGTQELRTGQVFAILPSVRHEVQATLPSTFLLTLSWPESDKLKAMPHRGYGS
jgi:quercetin dioxygenase-like cupin family protein